jgi:hypothetical protein
MRADYDAAERRQQDEDEERDEAEEDEEEDGEEAEAEDEAGDEDEEGDEDKPSKKKKAPAKAKAKAKAPKAKSTRSRSAKVVRMKQVWGVFNNSNQRVATYEYPKRKEADEHAAKLTADKKSTHFVQPVKEPIEEKKEE